MLIPIALAAILAATLLRLAGFSLQLPSRRPSMALSSKRRGPEEAYRDVDVVFQPESSSLRLEYGHSPGALVFGWPAKGGLYVLTAFAVEVGFLGYGRFEQVPRPSAANPGAAAGEEVHCNKSRYHHAMLQNYRLRRISGTPMRYRRLCIEPDLYINLIV